MNTQEFIEKAKKIHGDKYDYSKVEYKGAHTKVCIICPEHGEFWQEANSHIIQKSRCPKCVNNNIRLTTEEFVRRAKEVHGDKYDYSKVVYKSSFEKICIICPEHGEFWQTPYNHTSKKCECPKCSGNAKLTTDEFIKKAREIHGDKYDYSKVEYKNYNTKVCIICPKHGEFWQTPRDHLNDKGCPKCCRSILEENVAIILNEKNINYTQQKTFSWLKNKNKLRLDFYLPDYNIAIECQGRQHFEPIAVFGGKKGYSYTLKRDLSKYNKCLSNNVKLIYYVPESLVEEVINNKKYNNIYIIVKMYSLI